MYHVERNDAFCVQHSVSGFQSRLRILSVLCTVICLVLEKEIFLAQCFYENQIVSPCNNSIIPCLRNRTKPKLFFRTLFDRSDITKRDAATVNLLWKVHQDSFSGSHFMKFLIHLTKMPRTYKSAAFAGPEDLINVDEPSIVPDARDLSQLIQENMLAVLTPSK